MKSYIIASNRKFPETNVKNPRELSELLGRLSPRYIFFPYWSWRVPPKILKRYQCIGFHTGDIPGGSPIQNLIRLGYRSAVVWAFRMNKKIDKGEKLKGSLVSLDGDLADIRHRINRVIYSTIISMTSEKKRFRRIKRNDLQGSTLDQCYDDIRMRDEEGFEHTFIEHRGIRIEFSRAARRDGYILADAKIFCK